MKLAKILENLNSFEKNSFLKIIDGLIDSGSVNRKEIDKILSDRPKDLKSVDNQNVQEVFNLLESEFVRHIQSELSNTTSQMDVLIDIISRDGNCIMRFDWFSRLYDAELKSLKTRVKELGQSFNDPKSEIGEERKRDYQIYRACLETAYQNDDLSNLERKITSDEQTILVTLGKELGLSQEEIKLINYLIVPLEKISVDDAINELKNAGLIFYSKKQNTIYVADEVVRCARKSRGKLVAAKFFRRVLKSLREPQVNLICRRHNIDWRMPFDEKLKTIINQGLSFQTVLAVDVFKDDVNLNDRKKFINELCDTKLQISPALKGTKVEDKIDNLIAYFEATEKDEKVGISVDGYERLLIDLDSVLPKLNGRLRAEFELQDEKILNSTYLLDYNIKPRDVLELVEENELKQFCEKQSVKSRGDLILNILDAYEDTENLMLENYQNIAYRNLAALKENNIQVKEAELGLKFEDLTKLVFENLGLNVDEKLKKKLNTAKDKIDIVLNLGDDGLILIECKTVKESGYNKFSSVSRQMKAYAKLAMGNGFTVVKSLLVAPEFSDDFISECGMEFELNLSLIKASSLIAILDAFKESKHEQFPYKLLLKDVLIQEDRIIKAINKK
jgi:hypothetical protein